MSPTENLSIPSIGDPGPDRTTPIIRLPTGGETLQIDAVTIRILADRAVTGGAWALVEYSAPPGFAGPPLHRHLQTTEAFYVLSGTLTFTVLAAQSAAEISETIDAPAGSCVLVPPGVVHAFGNRESVPATFLIWVAPAGLEAYFRELAALKRAASVWPPADPTLLPALSERYDMFPPENPLD
jgi:mannose-6-phosphate isomerase-like protein (cupin superfamily)